MNELVAQGYATLPSTEKDKDIIAEAIEEIDVHLTRIDVEREAIKAIADMLKEEFDMGKRLVNRLAATYHKGNAEEIAEQFKEYNLFMGGIFK